MPQIFGSNFILAQLEKEIEQGLDPATITLRFPPEPNGRLHIGHARAACLNFGLARHFGGRCFLRLDDTNPATESQQFADDIISDIRWLGFEWDEMHCTSDYFPQLYDYTVRLIELGLAYIDDQNPDEIRQNRGTLTDPGCDSPWRDRAPSENLALLEAMRFGEVDHKIRVVRARIDMAASNLNMRDPVIWRQRNEHHYRLGATWKIFPLYDFSHCLSDAIEGITHSLCTLEFADHRPLYDWFIDKLIVGRARPRQIEYARMNIAGVETSKRRIARLCEEKLVSGTDDPRLMTLAGLRRRGIMAEIIRDFCYRTPVTRGQGDLEISYFYELSREYLNKQAPRSMAVLRPLKLIIDNLEPDQEIICAVPIYPQRPDSPVREVVLGREIYIERDDFCAQPDGKFLRLSPGRSVRLRCAGVVHYLSCRHDEQGQPDEIHCRLELNSRGAKTDDQGNKVRATMHWVAATHAVCAQVQLLQEQGNPAEAVSTDSNSGDAQGQAPIGEIETLSDCRLEAGLAHAGPGDYYQFERLGYFRCSAKGEWIRTLSLRSQSKMRTRN
ncbi:MAG: glutamine--tRNA ligase [Proteobacteria bacterium]|nr:glutamine--tRNA ligase [Pseudomonadota bacterium]